MRGHESDNQCNFAEDLATKNQFVTELLEFPTGLVVLIARTKTQFFNTFKVNKTILYGWKVMKSAKINYELFVT